MLLMLISPNDVDLKQMGLLLRFLPDSRFSFNETISPALSIADLKAMLNLRYDSKSPPEKSPSFLALKLYVSSSPWRIPLPPVGLLTTGILLFVQYSVSISAIFWKEPMLTDRLSHP